MKRKWITVVLLTCLLVGCGSKAPYVNTEQKRDIYVPGEDYEQFRNTVGAASADFITRTEQGYYYINESRLLLCYWDSENKLGLPLCGRPECEHDDENCDAYLGYETHIEYLQYYGGWLYAICGEKSGDVCVWRIQSDGSTWEKVGTLARIQGNGVTDSLIHRGYAYYILTNGVSAEDGTKLYRLCLDGKEDSELLYTGKSYAGGEVQLGAYGNFLYIRDNHLTGDIYSGNLLRYQIHDGTVDKLAEEIWRSWTVCEDILYYDNGSQILAKNLTTGEEKLLTEPGMPVYLSCWGDYLVCDNSCGLWISESGYDQRELTVHDRITGEQLTAIPLTPKYSELIGVDGENLIVMIPVQQPDSDAFDPTFCVCSIQAVITDQTQWHSI